MSSVNARTIVFSPPPFKMADKVVNTMCYLRGVSFCFDEALPTSLISLGTNLYSKYIALPREAA